MNNFLNLQKYKKNKQQLILNKNKFKKCIIERRIWKINKIKMDEWKIHKGKGLTE